MARKLAGYWGKRTDFQRNSNHPESLIFQGFSDITEHTGTRLKTRFFELLSGRSRVRIAPGAPKAESPLYVLKGFRLFCYIFGHNGAKERKVQSDWMLFTACVRVYFIRLCSFLNNRIKQNLIFRLLNEEIVILKNLCPCSEQSEADYSRNYALWPADYPYSCFPA